MSYTDIVNYNTISHVKPFLIFLACRHPHYGKGLLLYAATRRYRDPAQTGKEQEIKRIYKQLTLNQHDLAAVRALVWNSASTLLVAKAPVSWHGYWDIDDVVQHLHDMYQQPLRIDPIYEEEKVVFPKTGDCGNLRFPFPSPSPAGARTLLRSPS